MESRYTLESRFIDAGDGKIHCCVGGPPDGLPLLMLHGLSGFSRDWDLMLPYLRYGLWLICPDLRGFGDSSERPDHKYPLEHDIEDLSRILAAFSTSRAIVLGHSRSGRIAVGYVAKHPERARALVMVDGAPGIAPAGSRRVAERIVGLPDGLPSLEAAAEILCGEFPAYSKAQFLERMRYYLRQIPDGRFAIKRDLAFRRIFQARLDGTAPTHEEPDWWGYFREVQVPMFLIRATRSDMVTPEIVEKMCHLRPDLEVLETESGHNIPGENPADLAHAIDTIVERLGEAV